MKMDRRSFLKKCSFAVGALYFSACKDDIEIEEDSVVSSIPGYYNEDNYLNNKIAYIKYLLSQEGVRDSFVFLTDPHWEFNSRQSPHLLRAIQIATGIDKIFIGGDIADGCNKDSYSFVDSIRNNWSGQVHCIVGNHEYLGPYATESVVYNLFDFNSSIQIGNHHRHYYFVDDNTIKTRYIILSSFSESVDGGFHAVYGYGDDQLRWLEDSALKVKEGWNIILFTHFMYWIGLYDNKISQPVGSEGVSQLIDDYSGPGRIIAVFHGHNHRDRVIRTRNTKIPVIITTCDKNVIISEEDQQNVIRPTGTIIEQAFDVVIVNEKESKIHCVRIGCPAKDGIGNNVGEDVEERIIEY